MAQAIGSKEWVSRCAGMVARLLPTMTAATATERAAQLLTETDSYPPEIVAAVYANESELQGLPGGGHVGGVGEWKLTFDLDGGSEDEIAHAVAAAAGVLKARGVSAYCGAAAQFSLDGFDDAGFDQRFALTPKQDEDLQAWFDAERAANLALNASDPAGQRCGELGAVPPEAISFAKAHRRWVEGWSKVPTELTPSHPRSLWLDRFTSRLGKLRPAMMPATAWQYAETTFELAADMQPEEAAEVFAAQDPPDDLGAPE